MAQNDAAVMDLGNAYILYAPVGTAKPTWAQIQAFDPSSFGSESQTVTITGTPTGGTFTLSFDGQTTAAIPYNATASQVAAAVGALSNVGLTNVKATGGPLPGTAVVVTWINRLQGEAQELMTASAVGLTGGSSPAVAVTRTTVALGWTNGGHTSLDNDFAPFQEGGEITNKGSRQVDNLRTTQATVTEGVDISPIQLDFPTLQRHYGGGTVPSDGVFDLPESSAPEESAVLMVFLDGAKRAGHWRPRASHIRNGAPRMVKGGWLEFPVRITWLSQAGAGAGSWFGEEIKAAA